MPSASKSLIFYAVLIPGLITVGTARLVSNMPGVTGIELTIFLFLASAVNLAICFGLLHFRQKLVRQAVTITAAVRRPFFVVVIVVVSTVNGILLATAYENAWVNSAVRWVTFDSLGLTKTSQHSALHFLLRNLYDETGVFPDHRHVERQLDEDGEWKSVRILKVYLKDSDTAFTGYEGSWSTRGHVDELYLSPACRHEGGTDAPIRGAGILIRTEQATLIEFLDEDAADCARNLRLTAPEKPKSCPC